MKKKILLKLYENLYKIRFVEEEISRRYSQQLMRCPVHLSIGQEAVAAALSLIMKKKDFAVSSHRAHAHYLSKGGSIKKMLAEIYGKKNGCSQGKGGSMHLIDKNVNFMGSTAIVGNSIPIGVGLALSSKIKRKKQYSFVFFGDAAVEEGVFYESVNFAVTKKIPVIFICENNFYSVYSHINERQPKNRKIFEMVKAMSIKSYFLKTYNPFQVYNFLKKKIDSKKNFNEPIFFEFQNYRWKEHCGPNDDNQLGYRNLKELKQWMTKDPLLNLENQIVKFDKISIIKIRKKIQKEILEAFSFALKSKLPTSEYALKGVYAK